MTRKNALLSVYHKDGIVDFAQALVELGWTIYASGGTAKALIDKGVPVTVVSTLVGGEAILNHRVVTLSREVHAGLLACDCDIAELESLGIPWLDLVCVDLYPLEAEIARPGSTPESIIEKTDIGGPTMLRSAAKGRRIVISDPGDRDLVISWLRGKASISEDELRETLAAKAEFVVAHYALTSAAQISSDGYFGFLGQKVEDCKYGENPWQTPAALYSNRPDDPLSL